MNVLLPSSFFSLFRAIAPALAAFVMGSAHLHAHEQQPHAHGLVHANVALGKGQLTLQIRAPLHDIVGFEHWPRTELQRQTLVNAMNTLGAANKLLVLDAAAQCLPLQAKTEIDIEAHQDEHDHESDDESQSGHGDVEIELSFTCTAPKNLTKIDFSGLFSAFSSIQRIEVQGVSDAAQFKRTLDGKNPLLRLN